VLENSLTNNKTAFDKALGDFRHAIKPEDIGRVASVIGPVATTVGLSGVQAEELVAFDDGTLGIAASLNEEVVGIILLGSPDKVKAGSEIKRLGRVVDIPVGDALLGRVIDATGRPLDEAGPLPDLPREPIEKPAPAIMQRAPVAEPLETGFKVIDALIPVGKGQRELILGDRQTGKTAIAIDTIANQRNKNVVCIYAAIGQRESAVAKVLHELKEHEAMSYTIVLVASGQDAPGLQFITPYAATTIGEYFMAQGRDVLIVYDDLTRHARSYRELSLLLERSPGREAYPGDIFYIHSRLLERSTHLRQDEGGGSMTALPIIETEAQNLSAFIPTNLISITDGQIYLSPEFFAKGILPAVDVGKSVSRVGGKAQKVAYRDLVGKLRLSYSQFEELETFARFATRLDEQTRHALERGKRLRELLRQNRYEPMHDCEQIAVMSALTNGILDQVPITRIKETEKSIATAMSGQLPHLCEKITRSETLTEDDKSAILALCKENLPVAAKADDALDDQSVVAGRRQGEEPPQSKADPQNDAEESGSV